ncbi:MAG TPA: lipocalin-like domain-containing protein [Candidatus Limnocylindrales bacterium]|nr:lipocalin-like domain-containing protein [Candidatus Limnocylindrales bacterium]
MCFFFYRLSVNSDIKTRDPIAGTWRLVSFEEQRADGTPVYPMGREVKGYISYDGRGHMSVQLMRTDLRKFTSNDPLAATSEEKIAAFEGYLAYWGTYTVNEEEGSVTHYLEGSLVPNWVNTVRKRFFQVSEDRLILTFPMTGDTVSSRLIWERWK